MSSKDKDDVGSNDGDMKETKDDVKEDLPEDMQVLDEVTEENDDGPGNTSYNEDDILEGDDQLDEEPEYLEAEDELAEDDLTEELAEDDLHGEEEENHDSDGGDGDSVKKNEDVKDDDDDDDEDKEKDEKSKEKKEEGAVKTENKDGADDEDVLQCPFGHTLREDTNSNRYGCTPEECHRKDDPNIIADLKKSTRDGREYRERLFLPNYKSFRIDMKVAAKIRSVVVGPLDLEAMQEDKVKAIIGEVEEFYMRFTRGDDNKCTGYVQFRFPTTEEAVDAVEKIEKIKEGLTVKRLVGPDSNLADKLIRGFDGDELEVPAETVKHLVSVCGIPTTTTKEQLTELFPQARLKLMAMKGNGTLKGYAYLEMGDEDSAKKLVEEHNAKPHIMDGHKLYLEKMQANFELFMVIDSDDVLTDDERAKIVRTLNMSQMSLDRRGTRMKAKEYHDLVRKVKMMKQKLAMDNRKRREKGMALPKPPMRRPLGAPGAPRTYGMTRGRGIGLRPARLEMRPRREGLSPRSSERAIPPPRNRPTHRLDDRYHSAHPHTASPRGDGYYGPPSSSRRELGPPRRLDSERGGRFSSVDRGSSRYSNSERGRSGKLNTHQTANAVNMLVGLTSLLSEMQGRKPIAGGGAPERRTSRPAATSERWTEYSERSRPRSSDYGSGYGGSSGRESFRESGSSYRDDWGSSRSESLRSSGGRGERGGHSHAASYEDSYYEERATRKRTLSERGGYDDEYYRSERGGMKRPKVLSRGRGGGPRGRY